MKRWNLENWVKCIIVIFMSISLVKIEPLDLLDINLNQIFNRIFIIISSNVLKEPCEILGIGQCSKLERYKLLLEAIILYVKETFWLKNFIYLIVFLFINSTQLVLQLLLLFFRCDFLSGLDKVSDFLCGPIHPFIHQCHACNNFLILFLIYCEFIERVLNNRGHFFVNEIDWTQSFVCFKPEVSQNHAVSPFIDQFTQFIIQGQTLLEHLKVLTIKELVAQFKGTSRVHTDVDKFLPET